MEKDELKKIILSVLLSSDMPLTSERLATVFAEEVRPDNATLTALLMELRTESIADIIEITEVASGFRAQIKACYAPYIVKLWEEKPARYSRAFLETLALIAYRQPITRAEIEEIRGVAVNSSIIKTFFEREWVRVVGHKDLPGKPELLATTKKFLDYFNLQNLAALPPLTAINNIEQTAADLQQQLTIDLKLATDNNDDNSLTITMNSNDYTEECDELTISTADIL